MPMQNLATNTAAVAETAPAPETATSYMVNVEWLVEDEPNYHAEYYMATSDDVRGLVLQADSLEEMEGEMLEIIPILLGFNHGLGEIAPDRVSVSSVGTVNPRGVTKYAFTVAP